jgi:hypothetical protein
MDANRASNHLSIRLGQLNGEMVKLFNWSPSLYFRGRLAVFARSVGPSNVDDLLALVSCEASEWYVLRQKGIFFRSAFLTSWGLDLVREKLARQTGKDSVPASAAKTAIERLSESELSLLYCCHLKEHPARYKSRAEMSPPEILWEETILRALDRERQRWRREVERSARVIDRDMPSNRPDDDPTSRLASVEAVLASAKKVQLITDFVESHFEEDDRVLFKAHFEQGLNYERVAAVLGYKYSIPTLRQRVTRMRRTIRTALGRSVE